MKKGDKIFCKTSDGYKRNHYFTAGKWYTTIEVLGFLSASKIYRIGIKDDFNTIIWFDEPRFHECFCNQQELRKLKLKKLNGTSKKKLR